MIDLEQCPACDGSEIGPDYGFRSKRGETFVVNRCGVCGHGFLNPQPSFEELEPYYQDGYQCYEAAEDRVPEMLAEARRTGRLRHVEVKSGMRVLDYGCGSGDFLLAAAELGAEAVGIEPSPMAAERARSLGVSVIDGTLDTVNPEEVGGNFDLITLNHVLEHVPDPIDVLRRLGELLAPGGVIWIAVPNANCVTSRILKQKWHSADLPRHIHQFTGVSIRNCAEKAGLDVAGLITQTPDHSMANSISLIMKHRFKVPYRLTRLLGLRDRIIAPRLRSYLDSKGNGEALLVELIH